MTEVLFNIKLIAEVLSVTADFSAAEKPVDLTCRSRFTPLRRCDERPDHDLPESAESEKVRGAQ